jgi:hypothetical protein
MIPTGWMIGGSIPGRTFSVFPNLQCFTPIAYRMCLFMHLVFNARFLLYQFSFIKVELQIPQMQTVKYLGLHLDTKLTWKHHITKKTKTNKRQDKGATVVTGKTFTVIYRQQTFNI